MHKKDNIKIKNFIQGLRPFSASIPKTLKKHLKKGGFNYSNIVDNWTKIVNKEISDCCYPTTIKVDGEMKNGILVLNVIHGKELEIEYAKREIIEKINSFFGYNCINGIILKIVHEKIHNTRVQIPKIKNLVKINKEIGKVENNQLKHSLKNFLKAYNENK